METKSIILELRDKAGLSQDELAEKVYVTNNEDVIFLVMADADWAKEFYQGFSKYVDNKIGKTLEKTTEEAELPPVIE